MTTAVHTLYYKCITFVHTVNACSEHSQFCALNEKLIHNDIASKQLPKL